MSPSGRPSRGVPTALPVHPQAIPATQNYLEPDPEIDLDIGAGDAREQEVRYGRSDNIGLGGHNGAIIFKRYTGD